MEPTNAYSGDNLTELCKTMGYERIIGETDWKFRKRVFLKHYKTDSVAALEILMGAKPEAYTSTDRMLAMTLFVSVKNILSITGGELLEYVKGINIDPLALRENRQSEPEKNTVVGVDYKTLSKDEFFKRLTDIITSSFSKREIKERIRGELLYGYSPSIYYGTMQLSTALISAAGVKVVTTQFAHPGGNFALGWK